MEFEDESLDKIQSLEVDHEHQMERLNLKLDRAVEAAKIKPHQSLREMQNNEKLVAVNERIEEAMNYRGELKKFEVKEAERVEKLRQENANNQRKQLLSTQVSSFLFILIQMCVEKGNVLIGGQARNFKTQYEDYHGQRSYCPLKAN